MIISLVCQASDSNRSWDLISLAQGICHQSNVSNAWFSGQPAKLSNIGWKFINMPVKHMLDFQKCIGEEDSG